MPKHALSIASATIFLFWLGPVHAQPQPPRTELSPQSQADFARVFGSRAPGAISPFAAGRTGGLGAPLDVTPAHNATTRLLTWNRVAMQVTALDHAHGPNEKYDQLGPHRSSRAIAMVHIAMYDAVNAITRRYASYTGMPDAEVPRASLDVAIATAAHDSLLDLFPLQQGAIEAAYKLDVAGIPGEDTAKAAGMAVGKRAAAAIKQIRADDGAKPAELDVGTAQQAADMPDKFVFIEPKPGVWRPDQISNIHTALGYDWGKVKPFVLDPANLAAYRPKPPPDLSSDDYTAAYLDVRKVGGDPAKGTATERKPEETFRGTFWAYDGTPALCAPPRLYNQTALQIVEQNHARLDLSDPSEMARFLAVTNTAMADTAIVAWEAKWFYKFWRPISAITDPNPGNSNTPSDFAFYPLGAPATNGRGPNFTPPFPSYPSGHAAFGGALFSVMRDYFSEQTSFELQSDEFNGQNHGYADPQSRPLRTLFFGRLADAEWENARSRIWLGIHWQFDADAGIEQGRAVARYVLANGFKPRAN